MDAYTAKLDMVANRICKTDDLVNEENFFIKMVFDSEDDVIMDAVNNSECEYLTAGSISGRLEE